MTDSLAVFSNCIMNFYHGIRAFFTIQSNASMDPLFPSSQVKLSHLISVKLDDKNFKQWKQQIDGVVRGHRLQHFVTMPVIPQRSPSDSDSALHGANSAYLDWEQ